MRCASVLVMALLVFAASPAAWASRVADQQAKCTITWKTKGEDATVSFGVKNCRIGCNAHSAPYDEKFALFFGSRGGKKGCGNVCFDQLSPGHVTFVDDGKCQKDAAAQVDCFKKYKVLRTNTYEPAIKHRTTLRVKHHDDDYANPRFVYSCVDDAWQVGDSVEHSLPRINSGREAKELELFADILRKAAMQGADSLAADERQIHDTLSVDDKQELIDKFHIEIKPEPAIEVGTEAELFESLKGTLADDEELTVGRLQQIYEEKLEGTGISAKQLLERAGLTVEGNAVDLDDFKHFIHNECP